MADGRYGRHYRGTGAALQMHGKNDRHTEKNRLAGLPVGHDAQQPYFYAPPVPIPTYMPMDPAAMGPVPAMPTYGAYEQYAGAVQYAHMMAHPMAGQPAPMDVFYGQHQHQPRGGGGGGGSGGMRRDGARRQNRTDNRDSTRRYVAFFFHSFRFASFSSSCA